MNSKLLPLLIDFDGVLRLGTEPAPDMKPFLNFLSDKDIPAIIISNSTLYTGNDVLQFFRKNRLEINIPAITCFDATVNYVKENYSRVSVYCKDELKHHFERYVSDDNPEAVVIGDLGEKWSYEIMNDIFRKVHNGAELVAMQMNKFWKPEDELVLDAGSFIKAIEHATGNEAILIGKPSKLYFQSALKILGYKKDSDFLMLGDDIETDIKGAQNSGGIGILIYTGKTKYPPEDHTVKPDYEVRNLIEVTKLLNNINS